MHFVSVYQNVKKTYHMGEVEIHAVDGVDFEINEGEFAAVFDAIAQCDQTVVGGHSPQHYQDDDNECNNAEYHVRKAVFY